MNSAASRHVVTPPIAEIGRPRVSGSRAISETIDSAIGLTAGPHMPPCVPLPSIGCRRHGVEIDAHDRIDRVDQRDRVGAAGFGGARGTADVGDVGRQLDDDRHARMRLAPARDHFDIFGHLADGRAHAALGHAVRAAEVQFDAVAFGLFDARENVPPGVFVARHHQRGDHRAVGPFALDLLDLLQIDLEVAVGDQFDVVEGDQAPVRPIHRAVARARDVDHRRPGFAEGLPHDAAPAGAKGALDIGLAVGRRRRGEPERIGRFDAEEIGAEIDHVVLLQALS